MVLRRHLAPARAADEPDAAVSEALDELVGPVGGGVGGDDELQPVPGIVELEQVLQPPLDHGLLVVGGDDHGYARQLGALADGPGAQAGRRSCCERIAEVRPRERAERGPEENLDDDHA